MTQLTFGVIKQMMTAKERETLNKLRSLERSDRHERKAMRDGMAKRIIDATGAELGEYLDSVGSYNATLMIGGNKVQFLVRRKQ